MRAFVPIRNLFLLALLGPAAAFAQTPDTGAAPTPVQSHVPVDATLNPALPTVFIVGDSTARNGANLGWGDHFAPFFDTARINVANRAIAGRSSRTYITEGHWANTLAEMKSGDYMLLQMGHNDGGDLGGPKPRGSLKGIGDETQGVPQTAGPNAGHTETVRTFGAYLRQMIDDAKAKGVHPILLTLTVRNIWTTGPDGKLHIERDMGYNTFVRQVAAQEHIPVLDPAALEADHLETLGPEATAKLFPIDHTHTSPEGATLVAQSVADALRDSHLPLATYLK
jgi:rhamnogalacturonan acetylesterase